MGMVDYVRVEGHLLPGLDPNLLDKRQYENESLAEGPAVFQTKDLENYLGTYVIKDGRPFQRIYERVPEEERPYHGKPEGDEGGKVLGKHHYRWVGSTILVEPRDADLAYHGDVQFYASKRELGLTEDRGSGWVEFKARFTRGDLEWIRSVE